MLSGRDRKVPGESILSKEKLAPSKTTAAEKQLQDIQRSLERAAHHFNLNAEQEDFEHRRQNQQEVIKANAVTLAS